MAQTSAPIISFEKTHHDFGKVSPGTKVAHKFNVTNEGNVPLQIKEIIPSCGCTITKLPKWKLEPGENTFIEVIFNSSGMLGNIRKSITVISDDLVNPKVELTFGAGVVQEIMPSKSVVIFNEISRYASASSATIRLESGTEFPVEVTEILIPVPYITCEAHNEENDVILDLSLNGQLVPKHSIRGRDTLVVHTTSKEVPTLQFVIGWDVIPEITASKKRVIWDGTAGTERRTAITLVHSGGKPFKILDIISTSAFVQVSDFLKTSAVEHTLDVIMVENAKSGMYRERLTVILDDPEQGELDVEVIAVLR